ncbi:heme biosynthesis HemY N-terminal domain-containing protein [Aeromonas hydrophila]|uniref:heme biosynthesis HemY N-terminal domain-containing protein n=1 Tax=Aeromonas hydrophila TaxID=644 RepID=UPI001C5ACEC5|nr:heme biosynthesis HemY N-terminal domain-containing protein [Aeromonas hydrophila]MBW3832652.1 heme biosynthesis protein HemY [Aeromonas hydrophila]MBW5264483.1 heme biosynthesis protein HemY [Aeromonas hydrophila]MBW5278275.1 heme biosynthesis protein HemY [Aeromonas hydrophila]MCO4211143.1 heme biosynthesis protein HemY [Aeromonas hydrophila]HDX8444415.1 heme biosynthesis protein HemY [Aeromonas hydrophila]
MIRLIVLVAAMVAGLIFGPQASGNKGYVLISLGNYTVESSVTSAVILAVLFYGALLIVEWLLGRVFGLRRKTLGWYGSRRRRKANQQTVAATLAMAEGHYSQAEKLMLKGASNSDTPLLNYLSAAKAAQARGDDVRRDQYLQKAQEENPKAELALTLTQTQLQIEQGQYDTALAMLESVYALNPRHPMVLDQLRQVHLAREDWAALIDLIPVLHKVGKLTPKQEEDLLQQAWRGRLDAASGALETLRPIWQELPRKLRQDPDLLAAYGDRLRQLGADNEAAELWLDALRKQVSPQLLARLPKLKLDSYQPMLTLLQKIQDQPGVDAALAQVYLLAGQLDDAQRLLEQEVTKAPNAAVYHALGQVMDKRRLTNKANEYYRQALQLADV